MISNELLNSLVDHFEAEVEGKPSPLSREQKVTMLKALRADLWSRSRGVRKAEADLIADAERRGIVQVATFGQSGLPEDAPTQGFHPARAKGKPSPAAGKPRAVISGSGSDLLRDLGLD